MPLKGIRYGPITHPTTPGSPADSGKLNADETARWAKVVKFAGLKLE